MDKFLKSVDWLFDTGNSPPGWGSVPITTSHQHYQVMLDEFESFYRPELDDEEPSDRVKVNRWQVRSWRGQSGKVVLYRHTESGRAIHEFMPQSPTIARFEFLLLTNALRRQFTSSLAEEKARTKLLAMLFDEQRREYLYTDGFEEVGRSGVTYLLRRNRPTLAFRRMKGADDEEQLWPLCALCLHPLAYFTGTWSGVMCPSDEVLTHLTYIRTDEHLFWRRANQVPLREVTSGV